MGDPERPTPLPRGPLQGLADLNEVVSEHQAEIPTFVRGLIVGAFVGAAIAGSRLFRRWRRRSRRAPSDEGPGGA